jgi:chromosome segregation ATPase
VSGDSTEWRLPECRARVRQLEAANSELSRDLAASSEESIALLYKLEMANGRLETLQRELDASLHRERALVAELRECRLAGESGHTTRATNVTPLRPKPRKP